MKRSISFMISILLALSLCSCGLGSAEEPRPSQPAEPVQSEAAQNAESADAQNSDAADAQNAESSRWAVGNPVKRSPSRGYVLKNNLEIESVDVIGPDARLRDSLPEGQRQSTIQGTYLQINGLKDKTVQSSINELIRERFMELYNMEELPPYRGSAMDKIRMERGTWELDYKSVYTYAAANVENILSISMTMYRDYSSDGEYFIYTVADGLNIDLRTGREIRITDLFADNVNGIVYLDNAIRGDIWKYDSMDESYADMYGYSEGLRLASPFTGITEDQKYYMNEDGSVTLILDFETPWAYCERYPQFFSLQLDGVGAYKSRFRTEQSLFEDGSPSPVLPYRGTDPESALEDSDYRTVSYGDVEAEISYYAESSTQLPYSAQYKLIPNDYSKGEMEDRFQQLCEIYSRYYPGNLAPRMYFSSYYTCYGNYTNVDADWSMQFYTKDAREDVYAEGRHEHLVYKDDNYEPMPLSEVFNGENSRDIMKQAFRANAQDEYHSWAFSKVDPAALEEFYDAALDYGPDFMILSDNLQLCWPDGIMPYLVRRCLGDEAAENYYTYESALENLYYKDLGMENLSIFNEKAEVGQSGGASAGTAETPSSVPEEGWAVGNPAPQPDSRKWVKLNNIASKTIDTGAPDDYSFRRQYPEISGLKDIAVQEKINARIKEKFDWMASMDALPPYTGARLKEAQLADFKLYSSTIYTYIQANFENILSLTMNRYTSYSKGSEYISFSWTEPLNFDLRTGREIKITDLFADNVDALAYLNREMEEHIIKYDSYDERSTGDNMYYEYGDEERIQLLSRFPGFTEDQKFYINEYSGNIVLLFDYRTPWVRTNFGTYTLFVSMDGVSAYTSRFASADSLFTDKADNRRFFDVYTDSNDSITESDNKDNGFGSESAYYSYPRDLPAGQSAYMLKDSALQKEFRQRFEDMVTRYRESNGTVSSYCWTEGYVNRVGDFTNVTSTMNMNISRDKSPWDNLYTEQFYYYNVFRGASSEPLTWDDILADGADRSELLKHVFWCNYWYSYNQENINAIADKSSLQNYFDEVVKQDMQFLIRNDRLQLSVDSAVLDALVLQYIGDTDSTYMFRELVDHAEYRHLGPENLTIFD